MHRRLQASDVQFVSLRSAVFCGECELISENNTTRCLACGSKALLNLSRVMGGSLLDSPTASLIEDAGLDRIVRELLGTMPAVPAIMGTGHFPQEHFLFAKDAPGADPRNGPAGTSSLGEISAFDLDLEPAISLIADRAQVMTGATGSAIALNRGSEIVCRARAGRTAPDLGVRLQTESGISGQCVRSGEILLCQDAESHPNVDPVSCKRLGVRSILAAPLRHYQRNLGILEVLSAAPYAFDLRDVATLQMLGSLMVAAISRVAAREAPRTGHSRFPSSF